MDPFEPARASLALWRAVEAQHVVSTMLLVDSAEEQLVLEELLDLAKPSIPAGAAGLHYLLFTPFRYPPTGAGSRFRRPEDPGVFYGAEAIRTACAELGYWRWRFLVESPALESIDPAPQTLFQVAVRGAAVDLRKSPLSRQRKKWTDPADYGACRALRKRQRYPHAAIEVEALLLRGREVGEDRLPVRSERRERLHRAGLDLGIGRRNLLA